MSQERVNGFSCAAANRLFDHLVGSDKEGPGELGGVARPACEEASVRLSGIGNLVLFLQRLLGSHGFLQPCDDREVVHVAA